MLLAAGRTGAALPTGAADAVWAPWHAENARITQMAIPAQCPRLPAPPAARRRPRYDAPYRAAPLPFGHALDRDTRRFSQFPPMATTISPA